MVCRFVNATSARLARTVAHQLHVGRLVLFCKHDRYYAFCDSRVGSIGRVAGERLIVVVNFEKDCVAVSREGTEVMLFIWIVGVTEIVIEGDGLNDTRDRFDTKGSDPRRHDHRAMREVLTQRVIQPANLIRSCCWSW